MRTVAVIGGGAAGMMAAVTASQKRTGWERRSCLRGTGGAILRISVRSRGVIIQMIRNFPGRWSNSLTPGPLFRFSFSWVFIPKTGTAISIRIRTRHPRSSMHSEVERLGIDVRTGTECREIRPVRKGFAILTDGGTVRADRVILCTGSKAAPATGSDGSGYTLAKQLGHRIVPVLPALVQLRCREDFFKSIAGIRAEGTVSILADGQCIASDRGEIQLTNYGISGIPVFQVSRYASRLLYEKKEVWAVLDFMPDFTPGQMLDFLRARADARPQKKAEQFLIGLFHKKLSDLWIRLAGIPREKAAGSLNEEEMERLIPLIKNFTVCVAGTNSFDQAQVCCGGVDTAETDPATMGSRYVPGLYFAGELLDVDGMCGGYNLTFAWASGHIAGKAAAEER